MYDEPDAKAFASINRGYDALYRPLRLSLGPVAPLEAYPHTAVPR